MHRYRIETAHSDAFSLVIPVSKSNLESALATTAASFGFDASVLKPDFSAEKGETLVLFPAQNSVNKVVLLGLGKQPGLKSTGEAFSGFVAQNKAKIKGPVAIDLAHFPELHGEHLLTKLVCAIEGGLFALGLHKKEAPKVPAWNETIFIVHQEQLSQSKKNLKKSLAVAAGQNVTRTLVYEPSNFKTPDVLSKKIEKLGKEFHFDVTIFDHKELKKRGMNGILAVGAGSSVPPRLVVLEYKGNEKHKSVKAAFVGKGITFDTGGVSIKGSSNMHYMKSDMAGAAAVVGLFCTLSATKSKHNVVGLLPIAENMLDGSSYRPSDVIKSYSGFGIEVLDTDAEGRIVLADALTYAAQDVKPEVIVDLATLTGSIITALGYQAAGLFTQNSELATRLELAGSATGERVWRMPMWDDYASLIASDIADVKNLGGPAAGSISAAKFLEKFVLEHPSWAHIDIAGVALQTVGWAKDRVATGYGVELLSEFLKSLD